MRLLAAAFILIGVLVGCGPIQQQLVLTPAAESVVVFRHSDGLQGCHECGMVAETDGAIELTAGCSCQHPELVTGTEAGAINRIKQSAANLGANAVWLLNVHQRNAFITHSECCSVSGFRAYGVAFRCDANYLAWHKKHEEPATP
jgi:hypothetical protein